MVSLHDRCLVYVALLVVCGAVGAILGPAAALWSLLQVTAVIEVLYRLGSRPRKNHC